jgi:uncharacterized protein DUF3455
MSRAFALTAFLLVFLVAACASAQPPMPKVQVPDKLKPGANELPAMIVSAKGVYGSNILGTVKERADAPVADAIPWLLLSARSVGSEGSFSKVTSIQRVNTVGGVAKTGCSQATAGTPARIDYTADYYFFTAK